MDIKTMVAILNQQVLQMTVIAGTIQNQASDALSIINAENSIADPVEQIKTLMAAMNIQMTAINSQNVIIQQWIDRISK